MHNDSGRKSSVVEGGNAMRDAIEGRNGSDDNIPWQVKAIGIIGTPAVIALYLVWVLAGNVESAQATALVEQRATQSLLREHISSMGTWSSDQAAILRVLRTNCINQAQNVESRERCLR